MLYFDTNILIYYCINQDEEKQRISKELIKTSLKNGSFVISSLVLTEFIFTLNKIKKFNEQKDKIEFFKKLTKYSMKKSDVFNAYEKCDKINKCRNINDFIHLEIANKYCQRLITFDRDYKNLGKFYNIKIEIL